MLSSLKSYTKIDANHFILLYLHVLSFQVFCHCLLTPYHSWLPSRLPPVTIQNISMLCRQNKANKWRLFLEYSLLMANKELKLQRFLLVILAGLMSYQLPCKRGQSQFQVRTNQSWLLVYKSVKHISVNRRRLLRGQIAGRDSRASWTGSSCWSKSWERRYKLVK